ncbi:MAG TPA: DNA polymerase I [Acidimicrobiales bacterium]|nr:DNA polymerase I [Acidimicrobiales bacterium]
MATYLLIDGHSLAYRAWFALHDQQLTTSSGLETQAVYGFVTMTTRMLGDFQPEGMAVAFDRPEPTFRDEIAADYKAGRAEMPDALFRQLELIRQFVTALGVPVLEVPGFEADDVLATLACRLRDLGEDAVIVTGDRDAYQLVEDPHIKVLYNRRGVTDYVLYDEAGILERTGVTPEKYPLLAALRGDTSDNLPGVPGVGDKTAAKLVNDYGDVEGIYANLAKCTPKLRESLAANEAQVRQNLRLTPVVRDVPVEVELEQMNLDHPDRNGLERLLAFLEMRVPRERLLTALEAIERRAREGELPAGPEVVEVAALAVLSLGDRDGAASWLGRLDRSGRRVVVEPAWAGAPGRSAVEGLALLALPVEPAGPVEGEDGSARGGEIGWLPGELIAEGPVAAALTSLLSERPAPRLVGYRTKELMRALGPSGVDVRGLDLDVAVGAYLLDASEGQVGLAELAERGGFAPVNVEPGAGSGQLALDFDVAAPTEISEATARRAELVAALADRTESALEREGARALYREIERPLVRVLAKMELAGIAVDVEALRAANSELSAEAKGLEARIQELAGEPFNVNSTTQLRVVLYERLGLAPTRKTKTGYSTDAQTLERLRDQHPIVEALLRYREVEKLRSTYGEGLLAEVAPDGRIHASFNQTVARTGRLSSDQPNLHNIPVRSEEGRRFREAFVAAPGCELLVADYNQIELRVIAHLAADPGLVAAFAEGRDIHATTAAGVFGVEPQAVSPAQRSKAKMISYGLAYGMEAYGLGQRLGIPTGEAQEILDAYFVAFPAVRAYMDRTVGDATLRGYTETLLGRRRYLPELGSSNWRIRQAAERQAMNAGIQGLAADIFKLALVRIDAALESEDLAARLVLQVHDEVLVEVPAGEHERCEDIVLSAMRDAYPLDVPLEVHVSWGPTWGAAKHA